MALTQSFATSVSDATRPSSSSQGDAKPSTLLPPETFDILPPLHELLARIDHSTVDPLQTAGTGEADDDETAAYADLQPLEPKDLPNEVIPIKSRIRKALRELEKLPDMDRTVEEQEQEIRELEDKARRQREVLKALGDVAKGKTT